MKLAVQILTFYMLVLALVPCGDGGSGIVELANHLLELEHSHLSDHNQHSNNCGNDACSPFCICSCCSTVIDAPKKTPLQVKAPPPIPLKTPSFISNINPSSFFDSIWQPPKLS